MQSPSAPARRPPSRWTMPARPTAPIKGRGAASRVAGRFEIPRRAWARTTAGARCTRTWPTRRTPATHGHRGARAQHHQPQRVAGHRLQPVGQSVPRLRARLRVLLRAALARLPGPVAGAGLRDQAVRQDQCGRAAARTNSPSPATVPSPIALGINTDGYQPIERRYGITRAAARGAGRDAGTRCSIVTKSALIDARPRPAAPTGARAAGARCTSRSPRSTTGCRRSWSRAPPRRTRAARRCARCTRPACRSA